MNGPFWSAELKVNFGPYICVILFAVLQWKWLMLSKKSWNTFTFTFTFMHLAEINKATKSVHDIAQDCIGLDCARGMYSFPLVTTWSSRAKTFALQDKLLMMKFPLMKRPLEDMQITTDVTFCSLESLVPLNSLWWSFLQLFKKI